MRFRHEARLHHFEAMSEEKDGNKKYSADKWYYLSIVLLKLLGKRSYRWVNGVDYLISGYCPNSVKYLPRVHVDITCLRFKLQEDRTNNNNNKNV